jgi:capsular polysaccharide transport system permease protein
MMLRAKSALQSPEAPPETQLPARVRSATITRLFPQLPPPRVLPWLPAPLQSVRTLSFIVLVMLPVAAASIYYLAVAADQYVAEFRLSLRTVDPPRPGTVVLFGGDAGRGAAAQESQIVTQYIASRAIVDELDPTLDLRRLFSPAHADWWARLSRSAPIERVVLYWQDQVDPFFDTTTGTIIVRVRAFAADDAVRLARAIVAASEKLVNELSARSRHDALAYAESEVAAAEARLKTALQAIREFRDRSGTIDPTKAADANATLATKLRGDLLKANAQLATMKSLVREETPAIRVLKAHIRSLEAQQRELAHEMTASQTAGSPTPALSQQLGSYEALDAERKFAEAAYDHALEGLDRARDNADRQHVYVESFVPPSRPEAALYPRRWRAIGTVVLVAFAIWAIGSLAVQSIREHL